MKRILLALLLIPVMCEAQVAEVSVKGGVVMNDLKTFLRGTSDIAQPVNTGGSIALTFGLPAGFRIGLALSAYELKAESISIGFNEFYVPEADRNERTHINYGSPLIPLEALLMKRFNIGRIRLDIGAVGGTTFNRTYTIDYENDNFDLEGDLKGSSLIYGALLGAQYRLGCRWAVGVEGQAKTIKIGTYSSVALYPVMAKISYSL